ncbi:hypothetical protein XENORESO_009730 [Xenotaenia resolanae]|uniref:Uncharacterized protein n=1 Tax=Xenotaenia resolanae TaxID=208358 RepID=A0ABV0VN77_9TELE
MVMVLRYQLHLDPNRNMSLLAAHPFIFCTHPRHCSGAYACRAVGERGCTSWTGQQPLTGQPETNQAGVSVNTRMDTPEAWGSNGTRLCIKSFCQLATCRLKALYKVSSVHSYIPSQVHPYRVILTIKQCSQIQFIIEVG